MTTASVPALRTPRLLWQRSLQASERMAGIQVWPRRVCGLDSTLNGQFFSYHLNHFTPRPPSQITLTHHPSTYRSPPPHNHLPVSYQKLHSNHRYHLNSSTLRLQKKKKKIPTLRQKHRGILFPLPPYVSMTVCSHLCHPCTMFSTFPPLSPSSCENPPLYL